ncbi:MAG: hypothetical protein JW795_07015 [Chitinivibrionales bacterium]|nr:hypothetical protein [Chitinivibrionales bacterium]
MDKKNPLYYPQARAAGAIRAARLLAKRKPWSIPPVAQSASAGKKIPKG